MSAAEAEHALVTHDVAAHFQDRDHVDEGISVNCFSHAYPLAPSDLANAPVSKVVRAELADRIGFQKCPETVVLDFNEAELVTASQGAALAV